ncbi:MAG: hypothetical protein WBA02_05180 [Jannaschia helgolandensis]|uniref:Uncharacterized protein n=1 Tax=Jannaschia helgolandensis TaxID=188906 RepID=A0A1H7R6Y6_9RHOB|nr:hypothetical protein [Jannaschia helgolandensis]SEL56010.1 hypothetical protein SAMN04488526_2964 [Jannaschia helgolandensis]
MTSDDPATHLRMSLREVVSAAPTKTLVAAGVLGLMWGPILASVLQVADMPPQAMTTAPLDISLTAVSGGPTTSDVSSATPVPITGSSANGSISSDHSVDQTAPARVSSVSSDEIASIADQDAALDRLSTMTRFYRLSNAGPSESSTSSVPGFQTKD